MKQGRKLPELAAELQRQLETKADYIADTRRMSYSTNGISTLAIDAAGGTDELADFVVNDHCHTQVAARLDIPKRYYDRLRAEHPALLDRNVNTLFAEKPEKRMVRTLDGTARAFLSDRYHRIDNYDIAEVVLPILGTIPGMEIASCDLTDRHMYLKATFPGIQARIDTKQQVGDVLQAGVLFRNSEVGAAKFSIAPYTVVLRCLNGITSTEMGIERTHLGGKLDEGISYGEDTIKAVDEALMLRIRDTVRSVASQEAFDRLVDGMRHLPQFKVEGSPVAVVEKLAQRHSLNEGEAGTVLAHLIEGGDLSAWGYVQAVTRTAEDAPDYDRASELERLGGALAADPAEWVAVSA